MYSHSTTISDPLSTRLIDSSKLEYDFGEVAEAIATSPKVERRTDLVGGERDRYQRRPTAIPRNAQTADQRAEGGLAVLLSPNQVLVDAASVLVQMARRGRDGRAPVWC